jgi:hypothetical protein
MSKKKKKPEVKMRSVDDGKEYTVTTDKDDALDLSALNKAPVEWLRSPEHRAALEADIARVEVVLCQLRDNKRMKVAYSPDPTFNPNEGRDYYLKQSETAAFALFHAKDEEELAYLIREVAAIKRMQQSAIINFKGQLNSQDPEVREAALQHLRQADVVSVIDSKGPRAILAVADKVEDDDAVSLKMIARACGVQVQVDDEQSDEYADESDQQIEELRELVEESKGPWKYYGNLQDAEKVPRFNFRNQRLTLECEFDGAWGPVFTRTRKVATQFVAWREKEGELVIADVQAVAHKPLEAVLMECYRNGARHYHVVRVVNRDKIEFTTVSLHAHVHQVDGWTVPLTDAELPKYMVTQEICIRMLDDGTNRGPVLAHTRDLAERYAAEIERKEGTKWSVVEIQTFASRPVKKALDKMVEDDVANCAWVIRSVAEDGESKLGLIYPVNPPAE